MQTHQAKVVPLCKLHNPFQKTPAPRLCIARALINNPELLLADEPTGNLDEANEKIVLDLLKQLKNEGKTIVLITHNETLGKQADTMMILRHGVQNV